MGRALAVKRPSFLDRVKKCGFQSADDFFVKNAGLSFAHMGKLVGMSFGGIQYHYRKWHAEAFKSFKSVKKIGGARGRR